MNNFERNKIKKEDLFKHICGCIIKNPGCAGVDGTMSLTHGGINYQLKPIKKKKHA